MADESGPKVRFLFGGPVDGLEFFKSEAEQMVEEYRLIFWSTESGNHLCWSGFSGGGLYAFCFTHKGYEFQQRTHNNFGPPDPETRYWDMPSPTEETIDGV
jgi:hypothetical protein